MGKEPKKPRFQSTLQEPPLVLQELATCQSPVPCQKTAVGRTKSRPSGVRTSTGASLAEVVGLRGQEQVKTTERSPVVGNQGEKPFEQTLQQREDNPRGLHKGWVGAGDNESGWGTWRKKDHMTHTQGALFR